MRKTFFLLALPVAVLAISSCKKTEEPQVFPPVIYPNYSQLKVGNYWIYQEFDIAASGVSTPKDVFDSCYIEKDTLIGGEKYFKMVKPSVITITENIYLRDSLHYLITSTGSILFSSQDFTSIFSSYAYVIETADTICTVEKKMNDQPVTVNTPAGTYQTLVATETFNMYPGWTAAGNPRVKNTCYAENIGVVTETLPFYQSLPTYVERRLVRYHLN
ncbi:MAG: hypothetical protein IPO83_17970 [Chitinophagaceae bacterium]|nr:hypothetical protein [Chitinophagaceae bacterium]